MAQRDRTAIHIGLLTIQTELFLDGQILSCERLVHFHQVDLVQRESSLLERGARCWNRSASHDAGINSGNSPTHETSEWLETSLLRFGDRHQHYRSTTVDNAARISGGHGSFFAEGGSQLGQSFKRAVRTQVIIFLKHLAGGIAPPILERYRRYFFAQTARFLRFCRALLRAQREFILHLAGDALL